MPLDGYTSLCSERQKLVVSEEKGRKHIANNVNLAIVNHYRIDGNIISDGKKCDFLLMNEDTRAAYLIELKGKNMGKAVEQLMATEAALREPLKEYALHFRIVSSKCKPHEIRGSKFLKFQLLKGRAFRFKNEILEEDI